MQLPTTGCPMGMPSSLSVQKLLQHVLRQWRQQQPCTCSLHQKSVANFQWQQDLKSLAKQCKLVMPSSVIFDFCTSIVFRRTEYIAADCQGWHSARVQQSPTNPKHQVSGMAWVIAIPRCRDAADNSHGKGKKRSIHEISYDALIQFASTSRVFYVQIAKMIHNPSRRREELAGSPTLPMQTAAAVVSITMRDALTSVNELVSCCTPAFTERFGTPSSVHYLGIETSIMDDRCKGKP